METFSRNQEQLREQVRTAFGANPALANFEAMARSNMEFFENAMRMFAPFSAQARRDAKAEGESEGSAAPQGGGAEAEIRALKDQLAEMQSQLDKIARDR